MNNYPITISTDSEGNAYVGAKSRPAQVVSEEKIYPSQMAYRVTFRTREGNITIGTRTEARAEGAEIIAAFPRSNGTHRTR
jgi:CTP-dependent riboflavin kinase